MSGAHDDAVTAMVANARYAETQRDAEIVELLALVGRDSEAVHFIRSDMSAEQVRRRLLDDQRRAAMHPHLQVVQPDGDRAVALSPHAAAFAARGLRLA